MIFQLSSYSPHLQNTAIPPHPMLPFKQMEGKSLYNKQPKGRQRKPPALGEDHDDDVQKKLMHRDIERRRRQEMGTLYASLRSLLPLEYIQGKRAISDHMNEAVKYIKHMQIRIKELGAKRDNLRKLNNWYVVYPEIRSSSSSSTAEQLTNKVIVRVNRCLGGLEVVLNCSLTVQMLPLSKLLDMLLKDGLNVVHCAYTNVEQRQMYTINLEVSDLAGIEPSALERKIEEALSSISNS